MEKRAYGEGKDVRLAFRVTPETKRELTYWAQRLGVSASVAMEQAVTDWITKQKFLEGR